MNYIKPALVVLVPLLNIIGQQIKKNGLSSGKLKAILFLLGFAMATIYGFLASTYKGWQLVLDAVVMTGLLQGALVTLLSFGTYDAAIKPLMSKREME